MISNNPDGKYWNGKLKLISQKKYKEGEEVYIFSKRELENFLRCPNTDISTVKVEATDEVIKEFPESFRISLEGCGTRTFWIDSIRLSRRGSEMLVRYFQLDEGIGRIINEEFYKKAESDKNK